MSWKVVVTCFGRPAHDAEVPQVGKPEGVEDRELHVALDVQAPSGGAILLTRQSLRRIGQRRVRAHGWAWRSPASWPGFSREFRVEVAGYAGLGTLFRAGFPKTTFSFGATKAWISPAAERSASRTARPYRIVEMRPALSPMTLNP